MTNRAGDEYGCICYFQAEDGIRYLVRSRGLGDVYKRQRQGLVGARNDIGSLAIHLGHGVVDLGRAHGQDAAPSGFPLLVARIDRIGNLQPLPMFHDIQASDRARFVLDPGAVSYTHLTLPTSDLV